MIKKVKTYIFVLLVLLLSASTAFSAADFDLNNLRDNRFNTDELFTKAYDIIKAPQAWKAVNEAVQNAETVPFPVVVGIIDIDGVDEDHPEFAGELIDGELKGRVDLGNTPARTRNPKDGHGTSVAGIIGANNISYFKTLDQDSFQINGFLSTLSPTFNYTIEAREIGSPKLFFDEAKLVYDEKLSGASIINLSIGRVRRSALTEEQRKSAEGQVGDVNHAIATEIWRWIFEHSSETLFITAAGNQGVDVVNFSPANLSFMDNVVAVGATNLNDNRRSNSNFGSRVNLAAPGESIYTPQLFSEPLDFGDYDINFGDTSGAAPFVTGVAGLLKAINSDLSPGEIKEILIETADPIDTRTLEEFINIEPGKLLGTGCYDQNNNPQNFTGCRLNAHSAVCHPDVGLNCQEEAPLTLWESFEAYPLGQLVPQSEWVDAGIDGSVRWEVTDENSTHGSQSIRLGNPTVGSGAHFIKRVTRSFEETGNITYCADMQLPDAPPSPDLRVSMTISKEGPGADLATVQYQDGRVQIHGQSGIHQISSGLPPETWHDICLELDRPNLRQRGKVNDGEWSEWHDAIGLNMGPEVLAGELKFVARWISGVNPMYIDNIRSSGTLVEE